MNTRQKLYKGIDQIAIETDSHFNKFKLQQQPPLSFPYLILLILINYCKLLNLVKVESRMKL